MLVFIDESGDPGFKLTKGSSAVFAIAMVLFRDLSEAQRADQAIADLAHDYRIKPEWKFNTASGKAREAFFEMGEALDFEVRAIAVRKDLIYSHHLKSTPRDFYNFFVRMVMGYDGSAIRDAKVVIDGSGDRKWKKEFAAYLRKNLEQGAIKKLDFKDSRRDRLVQLADMWAGAVARGEGDRTDAPTWKRRVERSARLTNLWRFQ